MWTGLTWVRKLAALSLMLLALAGCKTDIYTDLSEREANAMLKALLTEGIEAEKTAIGDALFSVTVSNSDMQQALAILDAQGLPTGSRDSIGQVFAKSGIVSSPFEERVRYIYALGEEVGQTLQQIDGVMVARVHLVMPEEPELGQELQPSSAAVFIKQLPGYDLDFLMPQVRRLVEASIEGLEYENVAVVLVEAQPAQVATTVNAPQFVEVLPGLRVEESAEDTAWLFILGGGSAIVLLTILVCLLSVRQIGMRRKASTTGTDLVEYG